MLYLVAGMARLPPPTDNDGTPGTKIAPWSHFEFLVGLASGVLATLLGFGLTVWWDNHKFSRDIEQRDTAIIEALRQETSTNLETATRNQRILAQEIAVIDQGKALVEPLGLFQVGAWDLMRVNIPRRTAGNERRLLKIGRMAQTAQELNDLIRSRENFRTFNAISSSFVTVMRIYDEQLQHKMISFSAISEEVRGELDQ